MKNIFSALLFICPLLAMGQDKKPAYPQNYFRNPLDIPIYLAGNFGECRPGHFHSGIDIKTLGAEGQPVHAAADGYISRIKMDKSGFGHAIYIKHLNGYTTLYGHLSTFSPEIAAYVHMQQYVQQRWDVDLQDLFPAKFQVHKGDIIALSGNTGGSTAPHLHFEIRDTETEHPLNPELFGLPIIDKKLPVPVKAVVYNLTNGFYNSPRTTVNLKSKDGVYGPEQGTIPVPVYTDSARIGIGLEVNDYMEGSDNTLAHYKALVYADDSLVYTIALDNIGYDETRFINAYADYPTHKKSGYWVQCLFQLPGNRLNNIYTDPLHNRGYLPVAASQAKKITVKVIDDFDNTITVQFNVKAVKEMAPATSSTVTKTLHAGVLEDNIFESPNMRFDIEGSSLYDSVVYTYNEQHDDKKVSAIYKICSADIPLHKAIQLSIKPDKPVPFNLRDKIAMMYTDGKTTDGQAATGADQGWYTANVRELGAWWLATDTVPPVIKALQKQNAVLTKAKLLSFTAKDAMTSVKKFKGMLDGKWVCVEQHGDLFFYTFDDHCTAGKHTLVFTAADENNNTSTITYKFTR